MNDLIPIVLGTAAASLFVAGALKKQPEVRENFWGLPNRTVRREQVAVKNNVAYGIVPTPQTASANMAPGLQAVRAAPVARGGFHASDYPLTFQGNVRENYVMHQPNVVSNCRAIQDFQSAAADGYVQISPVGEPVVVYDRMIYANQKSRLAGLGDPIRGDLPIAPINDGWFRPSVAPNIDLRQGAINVIAGACNETSNSLRDLQMDYSGKTALSNENIGNETMVGDVVITAFPAS